MSQKLSVVSVVLPKIYRAQLYFEGEASVSGKKGKIMSPFSRQFVYEDPQNSSEVPSREVFLLISSVSVCKRSSVCDSPTRLSKRSKGKRFEVIEAPLWIKLYQYVAECFIIFIK